MKTNQLTLLFALFCLFTTTTSCIDSYTNNLCISGVGSIVSEEIPLDSFKSIVSKTVVDVEIVQGDEQKIVVEGNENMIEELTMNVTHGELSIDLKNNCYNKFNLKVFITLPTIESVEVKSTGNVTLGEFSNLQNLNLTTTSTGDIICNQTIVVDHQTILKTTSTGNIELDLFTNELKASIRSTGDIKLSGSCTSQEIEMHGTGDFSAFNFDSEVCTLDINGTGDAKINVSENLTINLNSVGNAYLKGNPRVSIHDKSVGDLIYRN